MKLQIGIPCGYNSEKYTEHLISNIDQTISEKFEYDYLLAVTNSKVNINYLQSIKSNKKIKLLKEANFFFSRQQDSIGHGNSLNLIYKNMNTNYGLIVDSDVAFLQHSWDKIFYDLLDEKVVIVGSEYDGHKYKNFPNAICCFFDLAKLKNINIDWRPVTIFNKLKKHIVKDFEEDFFGVKKNSIVYKDTGFKVFYNIKKNGLEGIALKLFRKNNKDRKFINTDGEEYQINQIPLFTHLGRSLSRDFDNDTNAKNWRIDIMNWIKK